MSIDFTAISFQHPVWKQFVDFRVGVLGLLHGQGKQQQVERQNSKAGIKSQTNMCACVL